MTSFGGYKNPIKIKCIQVFFTKSIIISLFSLSVYFCCLNVFEILLRYVIKGYNMAMLCYAKALGPILRKVCEYGP